MLETKLLLLLMTVLDRNGPIEVTHDDILAMETNNKILDSDVLDEETQLVRVFVRDMTDEERQERELFEALANSMDSDF